MFQTIGAIVGLVTGILYMKDAMEKPPVPRCPRCHTPQAHPPTRYSVCPRCGQLMDWRVRR